MLNKEQKIFLLKLAREAIKAELKDEENKLSCPKDEIYNTKRGVFVSLHIDDLLRGCIGYIKPYLTIFESVKELALAAAFDDPRFPPLEEEEIDNLEIEISILSDLIRIDPDTLDEIVIGRDGLYITGPYGNGLLLPQVAVEYDWDVPQFLEEVCAKAGLPRKSYKTKAYILYRFSAEVFSDYDIEVMT